MDVLLLEMITVRHVQLIIMTIPKLVLIPALINILEILHMSVKVVTVLAIIVMVLVIINVLHVL